MANVAFDKELTALLVIDPYNDFISQGGKIWDHIRAVGDTNRQIRKTEPYTLSTVLEWTASGRLQSESIDDTIVQ